jgi:hypothetical protein
MMAIEQRNGSAHGILRIGDITTERRPVEINGRTYLGFVRGKGCPRSVEAEYRAAYQRYQDQLAERNEARRGSAYVRFQMLLPELVALAQQALEDSDAAYQRFLSLAPALQQMGEAPVVADAVLQAEYADLIDDDGTASRILRRLKWIPGEDEAAGEDDQGDSPLASTTSETPSPSSAASPASD